MTAAKSKPSQLSIKTCIPSIFSYYLLFWLVVSTFQPLWKIWKWVGMVIPNRKKRMFQTTNQLLFWLALTWSHPRFGLRHPLALWHPICDTCPLAAIKGHRRIGVPPFWFYADDMMILDGRTELNTYHMMILDGLNGIQWGQTWVEPRRLLHTWHFKSLEGLSLKDACPAGNALLWKTIVPHAQTLHQNQSYHVVPLDPSEKSPTLRKYHFTS